MWKSSPTNRVLNVASRTAFFVPDSADLSGLPEGFYLGSLGFDVFAAAVVFTMILAIAWMRTYWRSARCQEISVLHNQIKERT